MTLLLLLLVMKNYSLPTLEAGNAKSGRLLERKEGELWQGELAVGV